MVLPDVHLRLETDSGMFSSGRLDPGTRVLLDTVPAPPATGDLLDLGCGYGPIALAMAARSPAATVWAVDPNIRALDLCRRNAERAGLANVRCVTPGQAEHAEHAGTAAQFTVIWSNPPIRIGKPALHDLLARWLGRMAPEGTAYLVVQRNLGADSLHRWLTGQGWAAERVTSRGGYRVLRVEHPRSGPTDSAAEAAAGGQDRSRLEQRP